MRRRPTPSAPAARAAPTSCGPAMLAATWTVRPSRVVAGAPAFESATASSRSSSGPPVLERPHRSGRRIDDDRPGLAVECEQRAVGHAEQASSDADDGGDAQRARQNGPVRGRPAEGAGHPADSRWVESGGVRRTQVVRDDDAFACLEAGSTAHDVFGMVDKASQHLVADAPQVRCARPEVRVVQRLPCPDRCGDGFGPGERRALAPAEDALAGRAEQLLVLKEQQVSVEDGRLRAARAGDHRVARPADIVRDGGQRPLQSGPVSLAVFAATRADLDGDTFEPPRAADRDPRRPRQPAQHRAGDGRRGRHPAGFGPGRCPPHAARVALRASLRRVAPVLVGEMCDGGQGFPGLRAGGPQHDPVAVADPKGGDGIQAAGAHRASAGCDVRDGRRRPRTRPRSARAPRPAAGAGPAGSRR